jgi:ATP-dependent DNA helicase MPH1
MITVMGSAGEDSDGGNGYYDYVDEADPGMEDIMAGNSKGLAQYEPADISRPAKRRRTSYCSTEDDSIGDFIDDDEESAPATRKGKPSKTSRRQSAAEDLIEEDSEDIAQAKKRSKYKIHIPRTNEILETTIQYGTQLPANVDSSPPHHIRGPKWKLPRVTGQDGMATRTPRRERKTVMDVVDLDDLNDLNEDPDFIGSVAWKALQKKPAMNLKLNDENTFIRQPPNFPPNDFDIAEELADLPSDAFCSSPEIEPPTQNHSTGPASQFQRNLAAPKIGLRQTTLFGGRAPQGEQASSQVNKVYSYRVDKIPEEPTHHKLDHEALKTWTYPMNIGTVRDYQFNIIKQGLFHNMLVALPTGLGKTFIAATIMLNYFRWTKDAKIVFMAPTKPLVSQQVGACFGIAGIPRSVTTMLTGEISPALRTEAWEEKRVFFMTPQTLDNDLRTGIADPKKIVLLVIDEAHRATGNYSYVKVVSFIRRFSKSFRILALTATPGSSVEAVQEVIDGLEISKVEIRTENSMDIQQFTHRRKIEQVLLDPSDEIIMAKDLLSKALKPLVDQLCAQNAYWNKDPMSITTFGLIQAQQSWFKSEAGRRASPGLKGMMHGLFSILGSIAHGIKLLNFHGIKPFHATMQEFRTGVEERRNKPGKYRKQINDSPHFKKLIDQMEAWMNKEDFMGHPKLTYLCDTILNHLLDAGDGRLAEGAVPSSTRVIVFSEYRDSAQEICNVLKRHKPMIRPSVFVGQADSKRSAGMNQTEQLDTISKFKEGKYNVLVATSIGEEGLDIGQVDLIICYDASASPIRMLQRMGRTGRKRAGNIVLLLMRGKEEEAFAKAKDNYEQMQKMISSGDRFSLRHDLSTRIVPNDTSPIVEKKHIEIPLENTQDPSLPEPKRRRAKAKKKPAKKFHMPDGVETGFQKASRLDNDDEESEVDNPGPQETSEDQVVQLPQLDTVLLSPADLENLERFYQNVTEDDAQEVSFPEMTNQPESQRSLGPSRLVRHGQATKRFVHMIGAMRNLDETTLDRWQEIYDEEGPKLLEGCAATLSAISSPASSFTSFENMSGMQIPQRKTQAAKSGKNSRRESLNSDSDDQSGNSGSSNDEDLSDFIVGDEAALSLEESASIRSSPPPDFPPPISKPFFEPTVFNATQETNDDDTMPDLENLLGSKYRHQSGSPKRLGEGLESMKGKRGKRRRVVEEEDSDE